MIWKSFCSESTVKVVRGTDVVIWFPDAFGRSVSGRRERRGDSNTSDQGTGDEATLPRTEERVVKKKSGIRRSKSTQRSGQTSTPNVPTEVHKKQLFSGRRSGMNSSVLVVGWEENLYSGLTL